MTARKKPATARKAAKPVMAWAIVTPRNEISVWAIEHTRADVIKQCDPGPGERIARVRIVEVRR